MHECKRVRARADTPTLKATDVGVTEAAAAVEAAEAETAAADVEAEAAAAASSSGAKPGWRRCSRRHRPGPRW